MIAGAQGTTGKWKVEFQEFGRWTQRERNRVIKLLQAAAPDALDYVFTGWFDATSGPIAAIFTRESAAGAAAFDIETIVGGARGIVTKFV